LGAAAASVDHLIRRSQRVENEMAAMDDGNFVIGDEPAL
jgi:hypothetical protein